MQTSANRPRLWWALALIVAVAGVGYGVFSGYQKKAAQLPALPTAAPTGVVAAATPPSYPVSAPNPDDASGVELPLPDYDQSDADALATLAQLLGNENLLALFKPDYLIARIVATVDALPRTKLTSDILPVKSVPGPLQVSVVADQTVLAASNSQRYAAYLQHLDSVDSKALIQQYQRWYPHFQRAYRELGYPDGHFNDRLVVVIDHLLAAPTPPAPIMLVHPQHHWQFDDPALESLSVGHKLLLRLGPENAALVKARLRELRAGIIQLGATAD
jgi:hypothetical protein